MSESSPLYTNRLIREKSPYLLQHAHNPVDWYPWGEEAFLAAQTQDKPIFLSIGYATCHWCHVMERESFENIEVARLLNDHFINIKVDREELPEVDGLYMEFAQSMMAGAVGWPLNLILTPDLEPFFASTYLPAYSSHAMLGLADLIERMRKLWESSEREVVIAQAEKIVDIFSQSIHALGEDLPEEEIVETCAEFLYKMADPIYGGMRGAPKFPVGYQYCFLLRYYKFSGDNRALFLAQRTLDMMYQGGIYDHLGGGFSRYSVDGKWGVPHFEKMLYDNALLAQSYLEAWQLTQKPLYQKVCLEILEYILRDMQGAEGGFYSAEDADSSGGEGFFYTWPFREVVELLGDEGALFIRYYGLTPEGNFQGRNILHARASLEAFALEQRRDVGELNLLFEKQRKILWQARQLRSKPFKDDKILAGWNGLAIYTLAEASWAFKDERLQAAAVDAAKFVKEHLWVDGSLLRRWRQGEALFAATLFDYASMIRAALSLFEIGGGVEWLQWAIEMCAKLREEYKDEEGGAFYQTDGKDAHLLLRRCSLLDAAEPSGNAIHAENLLRLYQLTQDRVYLEQAEDIFKAVHIDLRSSPPNYCFHAMNLLRYFDKKKPLLVMALVGESAEEKELKARIYGKYIPHKAVVWQTHDPELEELLPLAGKKEAKEDRLTLYLCQEGKCLEASNDRGEIIKAIDGL